eukprot:gene986-1925_t
MSTVSKFMTTLYGLVTRFNNKSCSVSRLKRIVYATSTLVISNRAYASTFLTKETKQPLVQGVIGLDHAENIPLDSKLLIQIYESLNDTVIAGAKITLADISFPFRFQLFEENLLISKEKWKSLGDFEQCIREREYQIPLLLAHQKQK